MFSLLRDSVFSVNCARRKVFSRCSSCRQRQPLNLGSYKLALGSPRAVPSSHLTHSEITPASAATSTALIQPKDLRAGNLRGHRGDGNSTQGTIWLCTVLLSKHLTGVAGPLDSTLISHWHLLYLHPQHVDVSIGCWAAQQGTVNLQFTLPDLLLQLGNVLPLSVTEQAIHCSQT